MKPGSPSLGQPGPLLEIRNVTKSFAGVRALSSVSFEVKPGEVHAVLGENGAGKSTLMRILAGVLSPDEGEVWLEGQRAEFRNPHAALRAGIAMIYQELLPFQNLTVAENIFMGHEPVSGLWGWIDRPALHRRAADLLGSMGVTLAPDRPMKGLRVAELQVVEIAKALAHRAKIVIMDEPTSALSERETDALFKVIRELRRSGVAIIYISHKLEEVFSLADRATVLRDGQHISTTPITELTPDALIALMVGRPLNPVPSRGRSDEMGVVLRVLGLGKTNLFDDITFEVRRGEILGLAGLMGAGRTDVLNAIYGLDPLDRGEIRINETPVRIRSPRDALGAGIGLVTEDRKIFGLIPTLGVEENLTLSALSKWCWGGWIDRRARMQAAENQCRTLSIKSRGRFQPIENLSGGNQQKVVLGRVLLAKIEILLLDEPTRGVDIAAKSEIHAIVEELARAGKAIVLVSSEIPELLRLSHRLLVFRGGTIAAQLDPRQTSPEEILRFAMPI